MTYTEQAMGMTSLEREQLILDHIWQVQVIAARIHERLPDHIAFDDLVSAGTVGLISAIDNYDPSRNTQLKTYAEYKIRGAILDSLRGLDWAPRSARRTAKDIEAAISAARQRWGREPEEDDIAAELGINLAEYQQLLVGIRSVDVMPLESASDETGGVDLLRLVADNEDHSPSRLFERSELESLLTEGIERMPALEKTVLSLYYLEELSLKEVAQVLDVHFSRVSQLKAQAVLRLRAYIEKRTTPRIPRPASSTARAARAY
jgi:RNA polymerase sigma factor for flagellar operon FliA